MQEFGQPQYGQGIGGLQRLVGPSGEALAVGEAGWRGAEIDGGVEGEGKVGEERCVCLRKGSTKRPVECLVL